MSIPRKQPEHDEQVKVVTWARGTTFAHDIFAIPNGAKLGTHKGLAIRQARLLKLEGLLPGVFDLCLSKAHRKYYGLYIEMKAPNKPRTWNSVKPDQIKFGEQKIKDGYLAVVCFTAEAAIRLIKWYCKKVKTFPKKDVLYFKALQ